MFFSTRPYLFNESRICGFFWIIAISWLSKNNNNVVLYKHKYYNNQETKEPKNTFNWAK